MAGSSVRSTRRSTKAAESAADNNNEVQSGRLSLTNSGLAYGPISPVDSAVSTEAESLTAGASTEDVTSESGHSTSSGSQSDKSSSESSSVTSEESLMKTKEELIRTAQDLESQLNDLMKIYQHEKKLFIDKSIHLMESESHPQWIAKMEELQAKRRNALKIAAERQRLKIDSVLAEFDFAVKNVSDELEAAEKEIIDEFTSKRKRRAIEDSKQSIEFPKERKNSVPRVALKSEQIDNDLSMINRLADQAVKSEEEGTKQEL